MKIFVFIDFLRAQKTRLLSLFFFTALLCLSTSCGNVIEVVLCDDPALVGHEKSCVPGPVPPRVNTGEIKWITHIGTETRDQTNSKDPSNWVNAVNDKDSCHSVAVDASDNIICAGYTKSSLGATNGGDHDAVVMKFNRQGQILWITQLGEETKDNSNGLNPNGQVDHVDGDDRCYGLAVDSDANIYCAGSTNSALNDLAGGNYDIFVMKLNPSGVVEWVSHLGLDAQNNVGGRDPNGQIDSVAATEHCKSIVLDSDRNIYCAGESAGNLNDTNGGGGTGYDAMVLKMNSSGIVQWITQLGNDTIADNNGRNPNGELTTNDGDEAFSGIALDPNNNIYVSGWTTGSFNDTLGGPVDAVVAKFNSSTGALSWYTQLGADTENDANGRNPNNQINDVSGHDWCWSIAADQDGNVYCGGGTNGDLNEANGYGLDAFVMKMDSTGKIIWITQGGQDTRDNSNGKDPNNQVNSNGDEECFSLAIDHAQNIYCGGQGSLTEGGGNLGNAFVMKLNSSGTITWITELGDNTRNNTNRLNPYNQVGAVNQNDRIWSIALNSSGDVVTCGYTESSLNDDAGGDLDIFVMQLQ